MNRDSLENRQITILDTTLRDGQQCPGAGMSFEKNIEYARIAAKVGVDVLEAGFPSASKIDFEIVRAIAAEIAPCGGSPIIAGLCQLRREQIEITMEALAPAAAFEKARLHTYLPVDPDLMDASLGERARDRRQLIKDVFEFVQLAARGGMEVQFSPEGYSRMRQNFEFTSDVIRAAIEAGASVINCPDTIGGASWLQGRHFFVNRMNDHAAMIRREYPNRNITWSVHCHNDFGLAVDNTIQAVFNGPARQIEGCFNGIGERAGNAAIEQCAMVIKHFAAFHDEDRPFFTGAKTEHFQEISDFVSRNMLPRQPHWPIGGDNAARHSSGGHTNAILKNPLAYQAFDPRETGKEIGFLFGPLSGGNHARSILMAAGFECEENEKAEIAQFVKDYYAARRKGVTDEEVIKAYFEYRKPIQIDSFDYSRNNEVVSIKLQGRFFDRSGEYVETCSGQDSALAVLQHAIERRIPGLTIESYSSESKGAGIQALSASQIAVRDDRNRRILGHGEDRDIEISAMRALIDAVNQAWVYRHFHQEAK